MAIRYQFLDFSLDTDERKLCHGEQWVKLRPKVYQLLHFLIANRHRVVAKQEIFDGVWDRKFVSDATLNSCLKELRHALGDSGKQQRVIRTLHGQGYQFVADTERCENASIDLESTDSDSAIDDGGAKDPPEAEFKAVCVVAGQLKITEVVSRESGSRESGPRESDPEVRHQLAQNTFTLIESAVDRYGGHVVEWRDYGFVAVFGAPVALEDYIRRAVLGVLEIVDNIKRLSTSEAPEIQLKAGINAGKLLVASRSGDIHPVYTSLDGTRELGEQLRDKAAFGQLLVSTGVQAALGTEFSFSPLQSDTSCKAAAYEMTGILRVRAGVPQRYVRGQFFGRETELGMLLERFDRSTRGEGQVMLINAEPGMGKSRLVAELLTRLKQPSSDVVVGGCLPIEQSRPFSALTQLLRNKAHITATDSNRTVIAKLEGLLDRQIKDDPVSRALLLELFQVVKRPAETASFSPALRRSRLLDLIDDLVINPAESQVTVLVLEDLHWIDASTSDWLNRAVGRADHQPLFILLTCRPGFEATWTSGSQISQISLPSLSTKHAKQLLRARYKKTRLPEPVVDQILEKAQGNPFFIEEIAAAYQPESENVPDSVQAVLSDRIDRLGPQEKRMLQAAAVLGTDSPLALLQSLCEYSSENFSLSLGQLESNDFLFEKNARSAAVFKFKHALIQDVAYQSLLAQTRRKMHSRIADLLLSNNAEDFVRHPSLLAQHATAAGDNRNAINYWLEAGRLAYRNHANQEAISHIHSGLALLDQLPPGDERDVLELDLLTALNPVLMAVRGYGAAEVAETCERARTLCQSVGKHSHLFSILVSLWNYYWVRGDTDTALKLGQELLTLATARSSPRYLMRAHIALGEIQFHIGNVVKADEHLNRAIGYAKSLQGSEERVHTSLVACLCYASWCAWFLGKDEKSTRLAAEALALAGSLNDPFSEAICFSLTAERCQLAGDPDQCQQLADQAIAISQEQEFPFWEGTALVLSGWARVMQAANPAHDTDLQDDPLARIEQGLRIFRETGAQTQLATWLGLLAEACLMTNQTTRSLAAIDEAIEWINRTGERYNESEIHRLKALALRQSDSVDSTSVQDAVNQAREIARAQGAKGHLRRIEQTTSWAGSES